MTQVHVDGLRASHAPVEHPPTPQAVKATGHGAQHEAQHAQRSPPAGGGGGGGGAAFDTSTSTPSFIAR
jgi:hypothetical protein